MWHPLHDTCFNSCPFIIVCNTHGSVRKDTWLSLQRFKGPSAAENKRPGSTACMPKQHPTMRQGRADSRDIPAAQLRAKGRQVIQEASNLRFCARLRFRQERRKAAASSTSPSYCTCPKPPLFMGIWRRRLAASLASLEQSAHTDSPAPMS